MASTLGETLNQPTVSRYVEVGASGSSLPDDGTLQYRHPIAQSLRAQPQAGTGTVFVRLDGDDSTAVWQDGQDHVTFEGSAAKTWHWALSRPAPACLSDEARADDFLPVPRDESGSA